MPGQPGQGNRIGSESVGRLCFICGKPQWYTKALKQLGFLTRRADIRANATPMVAPSVVWAKFKALAEGAEIATRRLSARLMRSTALATGRVERRLAAVPAADVAGYSRASWGRRRRGRTHTSKRILASWFIPESTTTVAASSRIPVTSCLAEFPSVLGAVRCAVESNPA